MKLHELRTIIESDSSVSFTFAELDVELDSIFEDDPDGEIQLKGYTADVSKGIFEIEIETRALETSFFTVTKITGNSGTITGFSEPMTFTVRDTESAHDVAFTILGLIAHQAEDEDEEHREDDEDDEDDED